MIFDYAREAIALAEEGVDAGAHRRVMKGFGFRDGSVRDERSLRARRRLAHRSKARGAEANGRTAYLAAAWSSKSVWGRRRWPVISTTTKPSAKGASRFPIRRCDELIARRGARRRASRRAEIADDEIRERLFGALIARGRKLVEEGVALRPGDIDIVYVYGYGFPPHRGGPMWYAREHEAAYA